MQGPVLQKFYRCISTNIEALQQDQFYFLLLSSVIY